MDYDSNIADGTTSATDTAKIEEPRLPFSSARFAHELGDLILEKKGTDLTIIDVEKITSLADYIVIATAANSRQIQAMATDIFVCAKAQGLTLLSDEGKDLGWWVLLDYGDVIVHLMQEEARGFYDLDMIWGDGEVVRRSDPAPAVDADADLADDDEDSSPWN